MTISNPRLANDIKGIAQMGDYATPVGDANKVQALIDLIQVDATMKHRGHLDQMAPAARIQLLRELEGLRGAVT